MSKGATLARLPVLGPRDEATSISLERMLVRCVRLCMDADLTPR